MAGNEDKNDALAEKAYAAATENTPAVTPATSPTADTPASGNVAPAKGMAGKPSGAKATPPGKPATPPVTAPAKAMAAPVAKPEFKPEVKAPVVTPPLAVPPAAKVKDAALAKPLATAKPLAPAKPKTAASVSPTAAPKLKAAPKAKPATPAVAAKPAVASPASPASPTPAPTSRTAAPASATEAPASPTAKVKIISKPALTPPAARNPAGPVREPAALNPAISAGPAGEASAEPASAETSGPAEKTGAAYTSFAGLISNFMLEDTTMDMSANYSAFQDAVTEAQTKAKAAFEKSSSLFGELGDFTKGNVEAVVESGKILAEGLQGLSSELVAEGRTSFATMTGDIKELAAVKSPTEFFKLQGDILRKNFDTAVAYGSRNSETMLKLMSDVAAPLSGRVSMAMEKARHAAV